MAGTRITADDLVVHVLNVGFGDNLVVEFPPDTGGRRWVGIVDCCDAGKTIDYLGSLHARRPHEGVAFVCATHPHGDHVSGINELLKHLRRKDRATGAKLNPDLEFWDSGFRHGSVTYQRILKTVRDEQVRMVRVSSGMERYFGRVRLTALAPSMALRNRYSTYGVDMNNASVVLRLEHCRQDAVTVQSERYVGARDPEAARKANPAVIVLGGDAEFASWARVEDEYPHVVRASAHEPLVQKFVDLLNCGVVKISHHGSMHSAPLDIYERMSPALALISTEQKVESKKAGGRTLKRPLFPHDTTRLALEEVGATVLATGALGGKPEGTVVVAVGPGGRPRPFKLADKAGAKVKADMVP